MSRNQSIVLAAACIGLLASPGIQAQESFRWQFFQKNPDGGSLHWEPRLSRKLQCGTPKCSPQMIMYTWALIHGTPKPRKIDGKDMVEHGFYQQVQVNCATKEYDTLSTTYFYHPGVLKGGQPSLHFSREQLAKMAPWAKGVLQQDFPVLKLVEKLCS